MDEYSGAPGILQRVARECPHFCITVSSSSNFLVRYEDKTSFKVYFFQDLHFLSTEEVQESSKLARNKQEKNKSSSVDACISILQPPYQSFIPGVDSFLATDQGFQSSPSRHAPITTHSPLISPYTVGEVNTTTEAVAYRQNSCPSASPEQVLLATGPYWRHRLPEPLLQSIVRPITP